MKSIYAPIGTLIECNQEEDFGIDGLIVFGNTSVRLNFTALVMPHRGMTSLASIGLDVKPWLSASLA